MKIQSIFKTFPLFYSWTQQKNVQETELSILSDFKNITDIKALIEWIELQSPTHSEGIQILETGGELILMGQSLQPLLKQNKKASSLIKELRRLRFPISSAQQDRQKQILSQIPTAKNFKIKAVREQDRSALSIEFKSFNLRDFKQKIQNLNSIQEQLKEKNFWKLGE